MSGRVSRLAVFLAFVLYSPPLPAAPNVTFERNAIRADGITPGAQAICFVVAQKGNNHDFTVIQREIAARDEDRNGVVTFALGDPVVFHSIAAVADLSTGEVSIATPSGLEQKLAADAGIVRPGGAGRLSELSLRADAIEILVVRANAGAWRARAIEGGKRDKDGARNGVLAVGVEQLSPVGHSAAAPAHFVPGDFIVLIEPRRMQFAIVRVAAGEGVR